MSMNSVVDENGILPIPRSVLSSTGLSVGDVLVVEHAEPGMIRFRLASDDEAGEPYGRLRIEPMTGTTTEVRPD